MSFTLTPSRICLLLLIVLVQVSFSIQIKKNTVPTEEPEIAQIDCLIYKNCNSCINAAATNGAGYGCGWCQSTHSCMNATSDGQPDGSCGIFETSQCLNEDICLDKSNCGDCTANNNQQNKTQCVWCDNSLCISGNITGPLNASCEQWSFDSQNCSVQCGAYNSCDSCTVNSNCVWCNTQTCVPGGKDGPTDSNTCLSWNWNKCPDVVNCGKNTNCGDCTSDPSDQCGWCQTTNSCIHQSNSTTCSDYKEDICQDACLDFSNNCTLCIENGCGWCDGKCLSGNATGPAFANCTDIWSFSRCFGTCSQMTDCLSCISYGGACGWCSTPVSTTCNSSALSNVCQGDFQIATCPSINYACSSYSNCEICTDSNCMWCPSQGCINPSESVSGCSNSCVPQNNNHGLGKGAIAGIVITILLGAGAVGFFVFYRVYWVKRHYYERLR